jgi:hypothetical protein
LQCYQAFDSNMPVEQVEEEAQNLL